MATNKILLFLIPLLLISLTSAGTYTDCSIYGNCQPTATTTTSVNYSLVNVNNSQYFQGYTPTTLKDWIQGLFESIFVKISDITSYVGNWSADKSSYIPYTGANQNVDLGNNNLTTSNLFISNGTSSNNVSANSNGTMIIKTPNMEWRFY